MTTSKFINERLDLQVFHFPKILKIMKKHFVTRALHILLGLAVVHQLVISNFMQAPLHGKVENFAFEMHETIGLSTLGIVGLFWLWVLVRRVDTSLSRLIPWLSAKHRAIVISDVKDLIRALRKFEFSSVPTDTALASAIHGLGLVAVLAAAATGAGWLFFEESNQGLAKSITSAHEAVTTLVWAYLVGHAGFAVIHELAGHAVLRRMFPFGRNQ